jgi:hypothetical protein
MDCHSKITRSILLNLVEPRSSPDLTAWGDRINFKKVEMKISGGFESPVLVPALYESGC